ncbi:uncharacterized protein EI97DRAFT_286326 [Westerdykella ornata]|uniref:Uncharacterized protein n=1 Tax=Westerdykella ornata TaxID=318751 RepID=A0A6A6J4J9_WESOR|nr:uncharacterized protein EI97DRAFT_286326 [Westerdykella ornata]KAF2271322.1 hypothetical protein EI97DRAFT_286326 [Westerdykella ornata]
MSLYSLADLRFSAFALHVPRIALLCFALIVLLFVVCCLLICLTADTHCFLCSISYLGKGFRSGM